MASTPHRRRGATATHHGRHYTTPVGRCVPKNERVALPSPALRVANVVEYNTTPRPGHWPSSAAACVRLGPSPRGTSSEARCARVDLTSQARSLRCRSVGMAVCGGVPVAGRPWLLLDGAYLERMTDDLENGTHVTLGRRFRTPAHPHVLAGLGRALYCFLSLEESVTAILFDANVSQQFVTYRKAPAAAFRRWNSQIPNAYEDGIIAPLRDDAEIVIPSGPQLLGEVKNLSSLIPMAQQANRAIFELTGTQARGAQYTRAQDTFGLFSDLAKRIVAQLDAVNA